MSKTEAEFLLSPASINDGRLLC